MWSLVPIDDWMQLAVQITILLVLIFFAAKSEPASTPRKALWLLTLAAGVYVMVSFGGLMVGARRLANYEIRVGGWCNPQAQSFNPDKCSAATGGNQ